MYKKLTFTRRKFIITSTGVIAACTVGEKLAEPNSIAPKPAGITFGTFERRQIIAAVNTILPRSNTPGGVDVGVPAYVEQTVGYVLDSEAREKFHSGLAAFDTVTRAALGSSYNAAPELEQRIWLADMDARLFSAIRESRSPNEAEVFLGTLKDLCVLGYFTSELIAKEVLDFTPVPGRYEGCLPIGSDDRLFYESLLAGRTANFRGEI